jgi:hypothetical protein
LIELKSQALFKSGFNFAGRAVCIGSFGLQFKKRVAFAGFGARFNPDATISE